MNRKISKEEKEQFIIDNNLQDSYIDPIRLFYCRPLVPIRKEIGILMDNKGKLFFEETESNLSRRKFKGKTGEGDLNLIYYNGEKAVLIKDIEIFENEIEPYLILTSNITLDDIYKYFINKTGRLGKRPIPTDRKMRNIRLTDEEFKSVYNYVNQSRNGRTSKAEEFKLKEINTMFENLSEKMKIGENYNHNDFSNDLLNIWNYVRKELWMDEKLGF